MTELPRLSAGGATEDDSPMVVVRMSERAAGQLAAACAWARRRAENEWDNAAMPAELREQAMAAYEWLSWGSRWLMVGRLEEVPPREAHERGPTVLAPEFDRWEPR